MARTFTQTSSLRLNQETNGTVYLTVEHDLHSDLTSLTLAFPDFLTIQQAEGFSQLGPHQWRWDSNTQNPWLRFLVDINGRATGGFNFVDAGMWAIAMFPPINASWQYTGSSIERITEYTVSGDGVASSDGRVVFLGQNEQRQFHGGNQLFRFVVPNAASLSESRSRIRLSLAHAANTLSVGGKNDEVVVIAAPSSVDWGAAGLQCGANGFWAVDSSSVQRPNNTWVHEYVHTRQDWDHDQSTQWLVEGTTNYYAALLTLLEGNISFSRFHRHITTSQHSNSVLIDPSQWTSPNAHYTKGRRVIAALDAHLRDETAGQQSFEDVFRQLNSIDGTLSHKQFKEISVDVGGALTERWIEQYIERDGQPEVPDETELFISGEAVDTTPDDEPIEVIGDDEPEEPDEEEPTSCPVCGTAVSSSDDYCSTCGTALHKECPVCAHEVGDEMYCPECGTALKEECDVCGYQRHESEQYCRRCGSEF